MGVVLYHTLNFLLARKIIMLAIHSLTHTHACTCTAAQLYAELSQLNLNLPARVCIPLYGRKHQVLRVPSSEAVVLNSKSKVHECHCVHFTYTIYTMYIIMHIVDILICPQASTTPYLGVTITHAERWEVNQWGLN